MTRFFYMDDLTVLDMNYLYLNNIQCRFDYENRLVVVYD